MGLQFSSGGLVLQRMETIRTPPQVPQIEPWRLNPSCVIWIGLTITAGMNLRLWEASLYASGTRRVSCASNFDNYTNSKGGIVPPRTPHQIHPLSIASFFRYSIAHRSLQVSGNF